MFMRRLFPQPADTVILSLKNGFSHVSSRCVKDPGAVCPCVCLVHCTFNGALPSHTEPQRRPLIPSSVALVLQLHVMKALQEFLLKRHVQFQSVKWGGVG